MYTIMADYVDGRYNDKFHSFVDTDNHIFADRLAAEMTVDLLNEFVDGDDCDITFNVGIHSEATPIRFYVQTLTV